MAKQTNWSENTVKSVIFARILFLQIALKHIFLAIKIRKKKCDLPIPVNDRVISEIFVRILFSLNFAHAKFRENKTLTKISKFFVNSHLMRIYSNC